jgi:hypothetical protein
MNIQSFSPLTYVIMEIALCVYVCVCITSRALPSTEIDDKTMTMENGANDCFAARRERASVCLTTLGFSEWFLSSVIRTPLVSVNLR